MDDNTPRDLASLVLDKITALGDAKAAEYFEVSAGTILAWRNRKNAPSLAAAQKVWDDSLLCQSPEIWGGIGREQVAILLPMYEAVEPFFMISFIKACKLYGMDKIAIIPKTRTLIEEARNDLVDKFLLTKSEWCIFLDVDMILPCGNNALIKKMGHEIPEIKGARNAIERMMNHPKEHRIIGGLYRDRRGGMRVQCAKAFATPQENARLLGVFDGKTQADGLEDAGGWVALGMTRIHRTVFEEMRENALKPNSLIAEICPPPPPRDKEPFGFFGRSSKWRGEDVAFCRRAGLIGIPTLIDCGMLCGHVGRRVF